MATDATGGASLATAGDTAAIAYYTADGVTLATGRFGSWSVEDVAPLAAGGDEAAADVPTAPTTSVAIDRPGHDLGRVAGRRGDPSRFTDRRRVRGGRAPRHERRREPEPRRHGGRLIRLPRLVRLDRGRSPARHVRRDHGPADRGAAAPPVSGSATGRSGECGEDGQIVLDVVAPRTAFEPTVPGRSGRGGLHAQLRQPRRRTSPTTSPIAHRRGIASTTRSRATPDVAGPATGELDVPALEEGDYFFQCTLHPTT